ncbi:hypothetical protein SISSUDRAFT_1067728 [Sistotremastrum suecicum HHB10207 ss-3]|uniref:F-box domain-containing protein n=1 Tax=Sistotremastrum suecicum HHB10207 ss-3 TaxID=1314776 RepID=A0A165WS84_9AGAM|nr:hypothetical protein SISSUDRAFT_1067728 [Sistotremastrum suecicum HHB10207 ss-3]
MADWVEVAPEIIALLLKAARDACKDEAGGQSWHWMVLLKVCRKWRYIGFSEPLLWRGIPSVLPDSFREVFLERCQGNPGAARDLWIRIRDEQKEMAKGVALEVQHVHIRMWRQPGWLSPNTRMLAPEVNFLPNLQHISLHAGAFVITPSESYWYYTRRTVFHAPDVLTTTARVKTLSFTFSAGRSEPHVYYPSVVIKWLVEFERLGIEEVHIVNMGTSGELSREIDWVGGNPGRLIPATKRIRFLDCSREAVEDLMSQTVFPMLGETYWNDDLYEIRRVNDQIIFRRLV